jgi:hypothetical protein
MFLVYIDDHGWSQILEQKVKSSSNINKTNVLGENHRPVVSHCLTLSHNVVSSTPRHERGLNSQL